MKDIDKAIEIVESNDIYDTTEIYRQDAVDMLMEMAQWKDKQHIALGKELVEKVINLVQHWILEHDYIDIFEIEEDVKQTMEEEL